MTRAVLFTLGLLACSRSSSQPSPTTSSSSGESHQPAPTAADPATTQPADAPRATPLGVCNRMAAIGAVRRCRRAADGGVGVDFAVGTSGAGVVEVAQSPGQYRRILDNMSFDKWQLATSDKALAIVFWSGGDELAASQIRLVLTQLDAE